MDALASQPHTKLDQPLVLIVSGPPASGKTTIGRPLARALALPFLSKDLFKEILFDSLASSDREWSRRIGLASMQLCSAAQKCCSKLDSHVRWKATSTRGGIRLRSASCRPVLDVGSCRSSAPRRQLCWLTASPAAQAPVNVTLGTPMLPRWMS
jgi:hypothetical protein